jgi:iron complex outermembrane receptor protein
MAGYTLSLGKARLSAQLNVRNLWNEEYAASNGSFRGRINPGAPRSFLGMIRAEY